MGLDFSLYKKRKDQTIDELLDSDDIEELAYGRKSWELVRELATNEDVNEGYGILTKESWEYLMKEIDPIGDLLSEIDEAYDHYAYYLNHLDDEDKDIIDKGKLIFTKKDKELIAQYEYWYEKTFYDGPATSYNFSVGYMQNFYDAKDEVREVLEDPDYEVLMSISY